MIPDKSPKSVAFPVVIMVTYSNEFTSEEDAVRFITDLVDDAHAAGAAAEEDVKVPKSIAFPSVAIVE